jgi:hypothetical protein
MQQGPYRVIFFPPVGTGILTIRDRVFAVTSAELMGYITAVGDQWVCKWHVNIEAEECTFPSDDAEYPLVWKPSAYIHHLRANVRSWRDFDGAEFTGEDEQGDELSVVRDETAFRLYVFEHAPVKGNRLVLSNRDGHLFDLTWTGATAVYAGDEFYEDVPFRVEAKLRFTRVAMLLRTKDPEAPTPPVAEIFASVLDPAAFQQLPTRETLEPNGYRTWDTDFVPV